MALDVPTFLAKDESYKVLYNALWEYAPIGDIGFVQVDSFTYFASLPEWKESIWEITTIASLRAAGFTLTQEGVSFTLQGTCFNCQEYRATAPERVLYLNRNKWANPDSQYVLAATLCRRMDAAGLFDFMYRCLASSGLPGLAELATSRSVVERRKEWFATEDIVNDFRIKVGSVEVDEFNQDLLNRLGVPSVALRSKGVEITDNLSFKEVVGNILARQWLTHEMLQVEQDLTDSPDVDPEFAGNVWRCAVIELLRQGEGTLVSQGTSLSEMLDYPTCALLEAVKAQSGPRFKLAKALEARLKISAIEIFGSPLESAQLKQVLTLPIPKGVEVVRRGK